MIEKTREMAIYEKVCSMFEEHGISYNEESIDGYIVTFAISKDGSTSKLIIDCSNTHAEEQVGYGIAAFEKLLEWDIKEQERARKKAQRKPKPNGEVK